MMRPQPFSVKQCPGVERWTRT